MRTCKLPWRHCGWIETTDTSTGERKSSQGVISHVSQLMSHWENHLYLTNRGHYVKDYCVSIKVIHSSPPDAPWGLEFFWQVGESFFMRFTFQSTVYHNLRKFLLCTCDSIYSHVIHFFVWEKENFNCSIQHVNIKLNIICLQVHLDVNFFPFLLLLFIICVGLLTLLSN